MKRSIFKGSLFFLLFFCVGCQSSSRLSRVFVVDTQGFSQTITTAASLEKFEKIDFLEPQPYQKVMRTWRVSTQQGDRSVLTSYYPSSQLMQYLEGQGGRAFGKYKEWHENGRLKVSVSISGGKFDLGQAAETSWIFDGLSCAFDERGNRIAEIPYLKGVKEGQAWLYYPEGAISQRLFYVKDKLEGLQESWYPDGKSARRAIYAEGLLDGETLCFWPEGQKQSEEFYVKEMLQKAFYWNKQGLLVAQVQDGRGFRALFDKESLSELQSIVSGRMEGWIGYFTPAGTLWKEITIKNGLKEGPETLFFPEKTFSEKPFPGKSSFEKEKPAPKIRMHWSQGVLQGTVQTWFDGGQIESERQVVEEVLHGPYIAYYPDGSLRALEEYHRGKLIQGKYFALGQKDPVTFVETGQGKATLFDEKGRLLKEVLYLDGEPSLYPSP